MHFACLIRQIALNDEIDVFTWYFKLIIDLKNLNKYLTYCFDG